MSAIVSIIAFALFSPGATAAGPKLVFDYSYVFDQQCASKTNYRIERSWQREANSRVAEFQSAWNKEADALMQTLFDQTGKSFSRGEMTVTLTACKFPSMSTPFLVNVRRWLTSFASPNTPYPIIGLVNTTFHEFLHNFIVESLERPSPMIEKYQAEAAKVRSHLHLFALQVSVYTALNRQDMIEWNGRHNAILGGAYARAWEIVTKIEGHQPFVDDLKR